jgi:putative ABC transport system ATP-binding protein
MKLFRGLADNQGVAVCVVTHDHRWLDMFDVVLELEDGRAVVRNEN